MNPLPASMLDLMSPIDKPLMATIGNSGSNVHMRFFDNGDPSTRSYVMGMSNNAFMVTKHNGDSITRMMIGKTTTALTSGLDVNGTVQSTLCVAGEIRSTGEITAYYSDMRMKSNIEDIPDALAKIEQIRGVYYTQSELAESLGYAKSERQVGVIAQEVQAVLPEVIKIAPFDMKEDGTSASGEDYLTVQYDRIVPLLIQAIKEQNIRIKALEERCL